MFVKSSPQGWEMQYKDLNGEEHKVSLSKKKKRNRKKSKLHSRAIELIKSAKPMVRLCEELPIRIRRGHTLYLDIFLPDYDLAIEVQGPQHFKFMKSFHQYKHRFGRAQLNDSLKREWCEVNGIKLIELRFDEVDEWNDRLNRAIR